MRALFESLTERVPFLRAYPVAIRLLVCTAIIVVAVVLVWWLARQLKAAKQPIARPNEEPEPPGESERKALRLRHGLRPLETLEEGFTLEKLPEGIFGFADSPAHEDAPLFRDPGPESFEVHKLPDGEILLVGYVTPAAAAGLEGGGPVRVVLFPERSDEVSALIAVPKSRVLHYRECEASEGGGLEVHVAPAVPGAPS